MKYKVKLDVFEGPFDLLVYLIEKSRMDIRDIRISEITTQYIEYVRQMQEQDVELAEDFMVLAAELISIKTKMLLPHESGEEEHPDEEDPRESLVSRILEYRIFKEMAYFLAQQEEENSHVHSKPAEDLSAYSAEKDEIIKGSMDEFARSFIQFIQKKQRIEEMHKIYERVERAKVSLEKRMDDLNLALSSSGELSFFGLVESNNTAFNKVITFVSVLEIIKQKKATAQQDRLYGDILLRKVSEND